MPILLNIILLSLALYGVYNHLKAIIEGFRTRNSGQIKGSLLFLLLIVLVYLGVLFSWKISL